MNNIDESEREESPRSNKIDKRTLTMVVCVMVGLVVLVAANMR